MQLMAKNQIGITGFTVSEDADIEILQKFAIAVLKIPEANEL
jgi:hypothetical protein